MKPTETLNVAVFVKKAWGPSDAQLEEIKQLGAKVGPAAAAAILAAGAYKVAPGLGELLGYRKPRDSAGKMENRFRGRIMGKGVAGGGILGSVAGYMSGDSAESRLQRALIGGAGGSLAGGLAARGLLGRPGTGVKAAGAIKSAAPYPGYGNYSVQRYLPVAQRRELDPEEQELVVQDSKKWLRGPFASDGDSITRRLASPGKRSLLAGLTGGLYGAGMGAAVGASLPGDAEGAARRALIGAGVGAAATAPLIGGLAYASDKKRNRDIVEQMRRLPKGHTTIRDMKSDPVYQTQQDRAAALLRAALIARS